MATRATLRAVVVDKTFSGAPKIDHLTKESGILLSALAKASSNGLWHKYKNRIALPGYSIILPGGYYTPDSGDSKILTLALQNIGSFQSEPSDMLDEYGGGPRQYFKDEEPAYLEGYGQESSKLIIYGDNSTFGDVNSFPGFHQYAKANTISAQLGGATGARSSMFAVKWNLANCALVYNKNQVLGGKFVQIEVQNDGKKVMVKKDGADEFRGEYQVLYKAFMAFYSSSPYDINAITQIDATHKPTAAQINKLLSDIKADSNTVIYVNRLVMNMIYDLKVADLQLNVADKDYDTTVAKWNGHTIMIDDNLLATETIVLD